MNAKNFLPVHDGVLLLSNTALSKLCPREQFFSTIARRKPVQARGGLKFGEIMHRGLATRYRLAGNNHVPIDSSIHRECLKTVEVGFEEWVRQPDEWRTVDRACETMDHYNLHVLDEPFEILAVEEPLLEPILTVDGSFDVFDVEKDAPVHLNRLYVLYAGRADLLIVKDGRKTVADHKALSVVSSSIYEQYSLSNQFKGYCWLASQTRGPVLNALVNVLVYRRPSKNGVQNEHLRFPISYTENSLEEWHRDTVAQINALLHNYQTKRWPTKTEACVGKYGNCPFLDVCLAPPRSQPTILFSNLYTDDTWNPITEGRKNATK